MFIVAERAVDLSMSTWRTVNLLYNCWMTGFACRLQVPFEGDIERLMGVRVTAKTVFQTVVRFPFMTVVAAGDHGSFFYPGGMESGMTFQAG
jgi:hypothetical protein